jgi:arylformamidase
MKIIDLSHTISMGMPVYPGMEAPLFEYANTIEKDGFMERRITMFSHTGTHIDAPAHLFKEGKTLDNYNAGYFLGKAIAIGLKNIGNGEINLKSLVQYESLIKQADYLILNTGWNQHWGTEKYFKNYPVLNDKAAKWLTDMSHLKGIGVDAISIDKEEDNALPIHQIFLRNEIVIIENLTNLDQLSQVPFVISCFPLKLKDADGSPVRAIGIID